MRYGLLGRSLSHSYSPAIHAALGGYAYSLCCVEPEALDAFLRKGEFDGLNVTIPYKRAVLPYCSYVDARAERIGAVNTLIADGRGGYKGYNTDYDGFLYMARRAGISLCDKKVLVLGSGGTSSTVCAAAQDAGAREIVVVSRSGPVTYAGLDAHRDAQVIVNTTPVGMLTHGGEPLLDPAAFAGLCGVLDVVYNPHRTGLIQRTRALGIPAESGLAMLVAQAKAAAERFLGRAIPEARLEQTLDALYRDTLGIVLIGMPGSGKTTLARAVAARMGRAFHDTDEWVEQRSGSSIPELFSRESEAVFRDWETRAVRALCSGSDIVAVGGGAVLRPENRALIAQNAYVVHVRRDISRLAREGRPLSAKPDAIARLAQERMGLYAALADAAVENDGEPDAAVTAIVEGFYAYTRGQRA